MAEVEYDSEYDDNVKEHVHGPGCGCNKGQKNDEDDFYDESIEPDPYYNIEEHEEDAHEHIYQYEIIPTDWFEHLKFPSIKSSR